MVTRFMSGYGIWVLGSGHGSRVIFRSGHRIGSRFETVVGVWLGIRPSLFVGSFFNMFGIGQFWVLVMVDKPEIMLLVSCWEHFWLRLYDREISMANSKISSPLSE